MRECRSVQHLSLLYIPNVLFLRVSQMNALSSATLGENTNGCTEHPRFLFTRRKQRAIVVHQCTDIFNNARAQPPTPTRLCRVLRRVLPPLQERTLNARVAHTCGSSLPTTAAKL